MTGRYYLWFISGGIHSKGLSERSKGIHNGRYWSPMWNPRIPSTEVTEGDHRWLFCCQAFDRSVDGFKETWPSVIFWGIHRSPIDSLRKHQQRGLWYCPGCQNKLLGIQRSCPQFESAWHSHDYVVSVWWCIVRQSFWKGIPYHCAICLYQNCYHHLLACWALPSACICALITALHVLFMLTPDDTMDSEGVVMQYWHIEGILPKGPYLPCVSMAGRALFAGYPRHEDFVILKRSPLYCWYMNASVACGSTVQKTCDAWNKLWNKQSNCR